MRQHQQQTKREKNVQNTTGSAGAEEGQELEETPEERQAGYEKFKEKYRDLYGKDVKSHIDRRLRMSNGCMNSLIHIRL